MPRSRLPIVLAVAVLAIALGGIVVVQQFLAGDDVARLTLAPSPAASTALPSDRATDDPRPSPTGTAGPGVVTAADLAGTWSVAGGSVVGYRVREQLGGISALTDAVGRTRAVSGSATLGASDDALVVTAASFEADLTQLESDDGRRDNRIRTMGLASSAFPTATFVLASPIEVPVAALSGATIDVEMTGDLTIHGVTRRVTIPGQTRLSGDRIEVAGSLTFPFSDFGMTPPDIAGFVQVEDDATLELLLSLAAA
ncbi:MAG TPA: YceI family protein [Candidatus Limnocylindrales bacterium]|nr:YceI family protein [Candidatus Limnocylindrales bacterium]